MESPLSNLKVLDFSSLLPGPYASLMLADMGASVLKIGKKGRPDITLEMSPMLPQGGVTANHAWLGRNKRTMFLNLKSPAAVDIVKLLVMDYDIVIEAFRPGVMDRLGLGYDDLAAVNPGLIYCSLTGYGQTGPQRDSAAHDINFVARSGLMGHMGRADSGPVPLSFTLGDFAGASNAVIGILAAVNYRTQTGKGQHIDVAMFDSALQYGGMDSAALLGGGVVPKREETSLNGGGLYDFYETSDGQHIAVGALEPKFWALFCEAIGHPELTEGGALPPDPGTVKSVVTHAIAQKTRDEWASIFSPLGACVDPVLTLDEALLCDPQAQARGMVAHVPLPLESCATVKQTGSPILFSACPTQYKWAGYPHGYHTDEVLRTLGFTQKEIEQMDAAGVL